MGNVDKFMDRLKAFKQLIDDGGVPKKNVDACRPYLELEHFTREIIYNKSRAAAGQGLTLVHVRDELDALDVAAQVEFESRD